MQKCVLRVLLNDLFSGVSQGSVVRVTLFLLVINDIISYDFMKVQNVGADAMQWFYYNFIGFTRSRPHYGVAVYSSRHVSYFKPVMTE